MNERAKRRLPAEALTNEAAIDNLFQALMDFPGWNEARLDEWIDMVALGEAATPAAPHFRTLDLEEFTLELTSADRLLTRPPLLAHLLRRVAKINQRCQERLGRPILSVILSN
ncbi:MAG: hypothetical protein DYG89_51750 [Caldilinea sp. CFX5]|nr:hypothetical protein [Caldilinea sp. CFX5]